MQYCIVKKDEIIGCDGLVFCLYQPLEIEMYEDYVKLYKKEDDERPFLMIPKSRIIDIPKSAIRLVNGQKYIDYDYYISIENKYREQ